MARPAPALQLGFQDQGRLDRGDYTSLQQGRQLGARSLRQIVYRDQLKRTAGGGYDFGQLDQIINNARRWGIAPQLVLTNRRGSGMGDPKKYYEFVKAASRHFKGRVGRYSLENEPDLRMAPEKYRRLWEVGQRALAQTDPRAQVLFGEFSPHDPIGYARKVVGKRGLTASGFAWHPYQDTDPLAPGRNPYWGQGQIGNTGRLAHELAGLNLRTRAGTTPGMYMTEFGYGRYGNANVDPATAAKFWPRALEKARDAGVRQIIAYHLTGAQDPNAPWDTGLLNPDGSPRLAYGALAGAVRAGKLNYRPRKKR